MKVAFSNRFLRQYAALPEAVKAKFEKQLGFLLSNLRHNSLRAKKYDEAQDIWQARVDDHYRFYFQIEGDTYRILSIIPHPK
jgi:mRNA interferase RelE/StbE